MTIRKTLAATALALAGAAGLAAMPAHADGMPRPRGYTPYADPVYMPYNWSGLYFGGHVGGGNVSTEWTLPLEQVDQSAATFAGGAQAGLQMQWEKFVLGAEVTYSWIDAEQSSTPAFAPATTLTSDVTNLFMLTGRLGYAHENMLAYVKGGYASADVEFRSGPAPAATISDRQHGWVAGVGLDYGLTPFLSIGIECNFIHLNAEGGALGALQLSDSNIDIQTVAARLNFKFGALR